MVEICNQMNKHFVNVGPNLADQIVNTNITPTDSPGSRFVVSPVTVTEVYKSLSTLDRS